jgi:hypothetical protein
MNSNATVKAIVRIQRVFRAVLGARGLIACDHCQNGCISVSLYKNGSLCYPCLDICIERDQASWYQQVEEEEVDHECICEECGDPNGLVSRGNLCYDCEQDWQEYQVRHYSYK